MAHAIDKSPVQQQYGVAPACTISAQAGYVLLYPLAVRAIVMCSNRACSATTMTQPLLLSLLDVVPPRLHTHRRVGCAINMTRNK